MIYTILSVFVLGCLITADNLCESSCKPKININIPSGSARSGSGCNCSKDCPQNSTLISPTCPTVPTTSTAPVETTTPNVCGVEGYEQVIAGLCVKLGDTLSIANDLSDARCSPGKVLRVRQQSHVGPLQTWAWNKLGSQHVSFWTSGKGYSSAGGYKWAADDTQLIDLTAYNWHVNRPSTNGFCIRVCGNIQSLDYGSCSEQGLHYVCEIYSGS